MKADSSVINFTISKEAVIDIRNECLIEGVVNYAIDFGILITVSFLEVLKEDSVEFPIDEIVKHLSEYGAGLVKDGIDKDSDLAINIRSMKDAMQNIY